MVQTAEGALTEVHSMLQRIRELAVESANSTLSSSDAASVSTEITSLRAEINRIAGATTFNGQCLLTGALSVSQNTGAAGSLVVGTALNSGHTATISAVDVSGARANTTYTITSQAGGKVTLSDGTGNSQQVTLAATIGATGTMTINFGNLGVKLTVVGNTAKTAADLATDLVAAGSIATVGIGGTAGVNLVNGSTLYDTSTTPVAVNGSIYDPINGGVDDSGGATLATATASASVNQGAFRIMAYDAGNGTGLLIGRLGGQAFFGFVTPTVDGAFQSTTMVNNHGGTVTINYKVADTNSSSIAVGYCLANATFDFGPGVAKATVTNMAAAPTAAVGTYALTSVQHGTVTLTLLGGASQVLFVNDQGGDGADGRTLNFDQLGISFDITSNGQPGGLSVDNAVSNLIASGNNTIVVTSSGGGGQPNNVVATGAGAGANFQVGANAADALGVSFADARTSATGYGTLDSAIAAFTSATGSGNGIVAAAQALITATDTAISYVSTTRGNLGAVQNRLEHTTASISVASENLNASMSRIKDLDVASEMVNFTKTQILQQAGTAILAQANSRPQGILALLR